MALRDAQEALTLARLALTSLECVVPALHSAKYAELQALGHAWVGHAQRLLFDLAGAEQSFTVAELHLLGSPAAPLAQARVYLLKAYLRWWQRRLLEAQDLANYVIELFHAHASATEQAEALVLRALLHRQQNASEAAVQDLVAAQKRMTAETSVHLQASVHINLARCSLEVGDPWKALEYLPRARTLGEKLGHAHARFLVAWLEGSIAQTVGRGAEAESSLLAAWRGFQEIQQPVYAGLAGVDLAFLYTEQGRFEEAIPLLTQVLPWLASLNLQGEMGVVLELLQNAVAAREVTLAVIDEMRTILRRVEKDLLPTSGASASR